VCQPQEVERLRLALAPLCPALGSVSAELKEAGLFRVQAERELCQAFLEIDQETLRILPVLESNDCVVGITQHWLRHKFATEAGRKDLRVAMAQGGWRDPRSIHGYLIADAEFQRATVEERGSPASKKAG